MGSLGGDELSQWDVQSNAHEEKILVSVRLRPLNEREIEKNDVSDWECINNTTIIYKNSVSERSMFPTAYTFDRVFGCDSSTKQVYAEGAKEVALSAVNGINSTIFAYGQTSSGKTYTMSGITEHAVADLFDYIHMHNDREFVLKFSAIEIYNEAVKDLLSPDSGPLRLLDDPERGTIVEKLTEEILRDWDHLKELLSFCEAQRQIGETSLNETSSRSHQILRLTVESCGHEFLGSESSSTLSASVNFVDLAGSERATQTLSAGTRLKEGCHINRSLLTLGTVIRKLSKGRNGHIPYRDSKLTRILQNSLGGNARTAIICTMSPAHSFVEQSRNTLLFASCAKQVSTNAQVNLVMSDKALVKRLQRELARMESELRSLGPTSDKPNSAALLKEKELLIEKMDKEIKELKNQRDHAQSRVEDLSQSVGEYIPSSPSVECDQLSERYMQNAWADEYSASESSEPVDPLCLDVTSYTSRLYDIRDGLNSNKNDFQTPDQSKNHFLSEGTPPRREIDKQFGPDPSQSWGTTDQKNDKKSEDHCKEVRCIEMEESSIDRSLKADAILSLQNGNGDLNQTRTDLTCEALKQKIQEMQKIIEYLSNPYLTEQSPSSSEAGTSSSRSMKLYRSRSCRAVLTLSRWFEEEENNNNTPPNGVEKNFSGRPESSHQLKLSGLKYVSDIGTDSPISVKGASSDREEQNIKISGESDVSRISNCATELNEVETSEHEQKFSDDLVKEAKPKTDESGKSGRDTGLEFVQGSPKSPSNWPIEFETQQRKIIELWDTCNTPLAHRTYFFLLFNGDPSDSVYMEVELRRLSFIKSTLSQGTRVVIDGQIITHALSVRALNRERQMLSKQMLKKFSTKEREVLYQKWGIGLNTKQRRLQLSRRLWTDTNDMNHIKESAALVAKLVGFAESGQTPKEMFGLTFSPRLINNGTPFRLKHSMSSVM
ncbi:Kinesin-like protein KIN-7F [Camellia lanceoleosa]|uniref:Kinesin-like protein KIN-7F n=1 Tax=Camellia lanceoleosa TaxID=1840588 RepID=A0ACC0GV82_9ERIC|nr:Kinesin-like protein KIN-7F [Camellia lanceoleosa]